MENTDKFYFIFLNLMGISAALIPFFLIHSLMFYKKMGAVKVITAILSAVLIFPLISFLCFKRIFMTMEGFEYYIDVHIGESLFFIFAYMGLIAINYITFLVMKNSKLTGEEKTKSYKLRLSASLILLVFMIYLSLPSFLMICSICSKQGNGQSLENSRCAKSAVKLSVFPYQKEIIKIYSSI